MAVMTPEERRNYRISQLSQVGYLIATPLLIGIGLDYWLGTMPWFTVAGALLGPVLGFVNLLSILRTTADPPKEKSSEKSPGSSRQVR